MAGEKVTPNRSDPTEAALIIEALLPNAQVRAHYLELLASEIEQVGGLAPSAWGITLNAARVRLNVGPIEVLTVIANCVHVIVDADSLSLTDRAKFEELEATVDGPTFYSSVPGSVAINIAADSNHALEVITRLRRPALSLIDLAVRTQGGYRKGFGWPHSHSPGVIAYVSKVIGRDLPSPSYVSVVGGGSRQ